MADRRAQSIVVHQLLAQRLVFGPGSIATLGEETRRLGGRPLVIASARVQAKALGALGPIDAALFSEVVQHVPVEVVSRAREAAAQCDVAVAVGGGSAVGLAKVLARDLGLPIVSVPTTLSGSERTPIWGESTDGHKHTGRGEQVLPRTVIYDAEMFWTMSPQQAARSAINALAHSVEGTWMTEDPFTLGTCEQSISRITDGLARMAPAARSRNEDDKHWSNLIIGASLAGSALATAGTGLHHAVAHLLGGRFLLSHSLIHAVLLPYTTELAVAHAPASEQRLRTALGIAAGQSVSWALRDVIQPWVGDMSLAALGLSHESLEPLAAELVGESLPDGDKLSFEQAQRLLEAASRGELGAPASK